MKKNKKPCQKCGTKLPKDSPARRKYCSDTCRKLDNAQKNAANRKRTQRKQYLKRRIGEEAEGLELEDMEVLYKIYKDLEIL